MATKSELQDLANVKPNPSTKEVNLTRYKITIEEIRDEIWVKQDFKIIGQELQENRSDGSKLDDPKVINVHGYAWDTVRETITKTIYEQTVNTVDISKVVAAVNNL